MPLDWTKIDDLDQPPQTASVVITERYTDPQLDALFVEHVESVLDAELTPTQKAYVLTEAKAAFRKGSAPDGDSTLALLMRARKFVARFGPTK